jgi:tryptophan 2,3-dioxygenase
MWSINEMDYDNYLNLNKILTAQTPKTTEPLEIMFIVAHQSSELWFKVLIQDLTRLVNVPEDVYPNYNPTIQLQRIVKIFEHLNTLWDIIATMLPEDYERFRGNLGSASGKQSKQYIQLESLLKKLPGRWNYKYKYFLFNIENAFKKWQFSHMKAVERILGDKTGTGGTSGVEYLKRAVDRPLYADIDCEWKGW